MSYKLEVGSKDDIVRRLGTGSRFSSVMAALRISCPRVKARGELNVRENLREKYSKSRVKLVRKRKNPKESKNKKR